MLVFADVEYSVGQKLLLGPISLELGTTGITAVLGANGAGKSLFLQLCHGLIQPSKGSVCWHGQPAQSNRRNRGYVFQHTPIMRRSVQANIEFPLLAHGISKPDRTQRLETALVLARLSDRAAQPAASLSGGERQRMAVARAFVTNPTVLLLDEPSASLDPESTAILETMISEISAQGTRVILVTHDFEQSKRLADDALHFNHGKLTAFTGKDRGLIP